MSTYQVTVDVADFLDGGAPPRLGYATFARAVLDLDSGEVVTTAPASVPFVNPPATILLESNLPYLVRLYGVAAATDPIHVVGHADCSLSDLLRDHQVDPGSLQPLPSAPTFAAAIAALQAATEVTDRGDGTALLG